MRRILVGFVSGVLVALPLVAAGVIDPPTNPEDSPIGYEITEQLRVVRVYDAFNSRWIVEVWPSRCTVFEDGSARCPSYWEEP